MDIYGIIFLVEGTLERKEDRKKIATPIIGGRLSRQDKTYRLQGALAYLDVAADSPEEAFEQAKSRLTYDSSMYQRRVSRGVRTAENHGLETGNDMAR